MKIRLEIEQAIRTNDGPLAFSVAEFLASRGYNYRAIRECVERVVGADLAREWDGLVAEGER